MHGGVQSADWLRLDLTIRDDRKCGLSEHSLGNDVMLTVLRSFWYFDIEAQ